MRNAMPESAARPLNAVVIDEHGVVLRADRAFLELVGRSISEIKGAPAIETLIDPRSHDRCAALFNALRRADDPTRLANQPVPLYARGADGVAALVEVVFVGVLLGETRAFALSVFGVADQARLRRERRRSAAESTSKAIESTLFFSALAHDLRAPIAGVVDALQLVDHDALASADCEAVQLAKISARHALDLLVDTLETGRVIGEKARPPAERVNLAKFLEETAALWRLRFDGAAVRFIERIDRSTDLDAELPVIIWRRVIANLLSNAQKFTQRGEVRLLAELTEAGLLRIIVEDTGVGLPETPRAAAAAVAGPDPHDRRDGFGLGLKIVRALAERLDGRFKITPCECGGVRAIVEAPIARAEPATPHDAPEDAGATATTRGFAGWRVLLVDDNATNRFVAARFLEKLGCAVTTAEHGRAALQAADAQRLDLVLMDLEMPQMNGFEAITALRQRDAFAETPIFALTAYAGQEHRARVRDAGGDGMIIKPLVSAESLAFRIRELLEGRARRPAARQSAEPLVDWTAITALRAALSADDMADLKQKFISDVEAAAEAIARAEGDVAALRRATHTLSAVAGALGARVLENAARGLNDACHAEDRDAALLGALAQRAIALCAETVTVVRADWASAA